jgi:hypothetical protein
MPKRQRCDIALVLDRVVQLEQDVSKTDQYGRLLRTSMWTASW